MAQWTDSQQAAISARNRWVLVSAAAGSGKTSVLIERIMAMLREGGSLERMLVVTFTHAAAAEMRQRLSLALNREAQHDRHLRRQRQLLKRADIGTLHSICRSVIERHFQAAGTDPMAKVGDEGRLKELLDRAIQEEMELMYEGPDSDQQQLIDQYSDQQVEQMLRGLYRFLMAQDSPWLWLEEQLPPLLEGMARHPWYLGLLKESMADIEAALQLIDDNIRLCGLPSGPARYLPNCRTDRALAEGLRDALLEPGAPDISDDVRLSDLPRTAAPPTEDADLRAQVQAQRKEVKELLAGALRRLPIGQQALAQALDDLQYTAPAARALAALTHRCHLRYAQYKQDRQMLDYSDLEHLALKCLMNEDTRADIAGGYDALFVDEYQDISRIQQAIIDGLHGQDATLFMVGDVKQSIYRFRLADPDLFLDKQMSYHSQPEADQRLIHLSHNFRSRENVLASVNHVFERTLIGDVLEIDYDSQAALYPGRASHQDPHSELHILAPGQGAPDQDQQEAFQPDEEEEGLAPGAVEREALIIAQRIQSLLGSPLGPGGEGPGLWYRDMVILLRSASGRAGQMAQVLKHCGIPVYSDADQQLFDVQEVTDILTLLHVIDNPYQDIPLLAALKSPAFAFDDIQLASLRSLAQDAGQPLYESFFALKDSLPAVRQAVERLERWRFLSQHTPLDSFLRRLLRETGLYAQAGAKPQAAQRRANLRLLCERAAPNPTPQTLQNFLSQATEARRQENSRSAAPLGAGEDVVRIMTIHKAKGLEFPVVFLPDLARRFRFDGQNDLLLLHKRYGLALRKIDPLRRMAYPTLAGKAIQLKKEQETRSEEARLLYVAMTRASDRLIMLASPRSLNSSRSTWAKPQGRRRAGQASSMMDWVGASLWPALAEGTDTLYTSPNGSHWQLSYHDGEMLRLPAVPDPGSRNLLPTQPPGPAISRQMAGLPAVPAHPLKLSVTQLVRRAQESLEETPLTKRLPLDSVPLAMDRPAVSGISRGAATHRAMSAVKLDQLAALPDGALLAALQEELDRLEDAGILQPEEAAAVELARMAAFYSSPLGRRLLAAQRRHREWAFSLMVEAGVLLQGVLDCCFVEEGAWVLLDYKTDRQPAEALHQLYRDQMRWYMRALRDITGMPVKAAYLYALHHDQAIRVMEQEPIRYLPDAHG